MELSLFVGGVKLLFRYVCRRIAETKGRCTVSRRKKVKQDRARDYAPETEAETEREWGRRVKSDTDCNERKFNLTPRWIRLSSGLQTERGRKISSFHSGDWGQGTKDQGTSPPPPPRLQERGLSCEENQTSQERSAIIIIIIMEGKESVEERRGGGGERSKRDGGEEE
ncbi:unnamed protein product [Lota lota]